MDQDQFYKKDLVACHHLDGKNTTLCVDSTWVPAAQTLQDEIWDVSSNNFKRRELFQFPHISYSFVMSVQRQRKLINIPNKEVMGLHTRYV